MLFAMQGYREGAAELCELCQVAAPLEYDNEGRQLCAKCRAHSTIKELGKEQVQAGMVRQCPTCGPSMYPTEVISVGPPTRANSSGVTFSRGFQCGKCGRMVSLYPKAAAILRAVLVTLAPVSFPFLPPSVVYVFGIAWGLFAIMALIDLIQRIRYPLVRS